MHRGSFLRRYNVLRLRYFHKYALLKVLFQCMCHQRDTTQWICSGISSRPSELELGDKNTK